MVAAHEGKHKDLVKFISGQTCIGVRQVQRLVSGYQLEREITRVSAFSEYSEKPQPGILIQCLSASDPVTLAKETSVNRHFPEDPQPSILYDVCKCSESLHLEPPSLPEGQYRCLVNM